MALGESMQIVILLAVIVTLLALEAPRCVTPPWLIAVGGVSYLLGTAALSLSGASLGLRAMRAPFSAASRLLVRHRRLTAMTQVWMIGGAAALVALGYGRWVMEDLHLENLPLVGKLLVIAPFTVALLLNWALAYPLHRETRLRMSEAALAAGRSGVPGWTRIQYVLYNVRHHLLFIAVPVTLLVLIEDLLLLYLHPHLPKDWADPITMGLMLATGACVFLLLPMLIVRIWRTAPMPDGPLRRKLEEVSRALGLRFREMRIWRSEGVIANAGVIGLLPSARYVLLSDGLIENLPDEEIRAIFAHEAGHIVHRHIPFAVMFVVGVSLLCAAGGELALRLLGGTEWTGGALSAALLIGIGGGLFGWISRRFERQSDVVAAWLSDPSAPDGAEDGRITPEGAAVFARALERVAWLNGLSPRQRNWRHGSIAWRISHILWLAGRGGTHHEIDRLVRRIKRALWAGLIGAAVALTLVVRAESTPGEGSEPPRAAEGGILVRAPEIEDTV
jgi:STE24 endopeptidase